MKVVPDFSIHPSTKIWIKTKKITKKGLFISRLLLSFSHQQKGLLCFEPNKRKTLVVNKAHLFVVKQEICC